MKYEVVLFDADDTLLDFGRCEEAALKTVFENNNIEFDGAKYLPKYREISAVLWKDYEQKRIAQDFLKVERFRQLLDFFYLPSTPKTFSRDYIEALSKENHIIEKADWVLSQLHKKCKIAIVTNGIQYVQLNRINNSVIAKYIDHLIISEEAGAAKPAAQFFEYTFSKIEHANKETAIIIGDSLSSDILGGSQFGIDTCWYNPNQKERNNKVTPTFEIQAIEEILDIVN